MTEADLEAQGQSGDAAPAADVRLRRPPIPRQRGAAVLGALSLAAGAALLALLYAPLSPAVDVGPRPAQEAATLVAVLRGGNAVRGGELWRVKGCGECHGLRAEGGRFPGAPSLQRATLTCSDLHAAVRAPRDPTKGMPPYPPEQAPDAAIADICAWLAALR